MSQHTSGGSGRSPGALSSRVALIGIDGVPFSLIEDNPDCFEHLDAIATGGTADAIESIIPPESSACWPSLTTGTNPGRTGVYGFLDPQPRDQTTYIPTGQDVSGTRLWDHVAKAGGRATVLNVPVTYPPSSTVDTMVAGFLSPSLEAAAGDEATYRTLQAHDYRVDVDVSLGHRSDKSAFIKDAMATLEARQAVFKDYAESGDWDLFVGVYMTPDRVNHFLFDDLVADGEYAEAVWAFYRQLDAAIGELCEALPADVEVVIVSDHGFTTLDSEVHCNRLLETAGWLEYATEDPSEPADLAPSTRAYSLIPGRFYLTNASTRGEYTEELEALSAVLAEVTGSDGQPVADRIIEGASAFDGPYTGIAPDLVVLPTAGFDLKAGFDSADAVFTDGPRTGMHTYDNATLVSTLEGVDTGDATIMDVTPTVLDLLGLDHDGLDGRSLLTER